MSGHVQTYQEKVWVFNQEMAVSRLLDLPCELLEHVYQMLEIADRAKLNIALPKCAAMTAHIDKKLVVVHMFFKRRTRILGASEITIEDTSCAMRRFFQDNRYDPTILRVIRESPQLAQILWYSSFDPIALIMGQEPLHAGVIVWADVEQDVGSVVQAVESRGTPSIFNSLMASENLVRSYVVANPGTFAFGIVNCMNNYGLLPHIMHLADDNECGFPVVEARRYLSSLKISRIFLATPMKLKMIMDVVGISQTVLDDLLEDAARRMLVPTVCYLIQVGASF